MKVVFANAETAEAFVRDVSSLPFDVNIADGSHIFDAKSIMAVLNLDFTKTFDVQPVNGNEDELAAFNGLMKKYERKENTE